MTREDQLIRKDRMRFTKDSLSSTLVLLGIVFNALYFVSLYQSDVGNYYYTWQIGASIIYNLLFMLGAFLMSEGVKSRKSGYSIPLVAIGIMQVVRIFYLPAQAHAALAIVNGVETPVMNDKQYIYMVVCLLLSAACCVAAGVMSYINCKTLADYMRSMENQGA